VSLGGGGGTLCSAIRSFYRLLHELLNSLEEMKAAHQISGLAVYARLFITSTLKENAK
jgi:hypothetical protein